MSTTNSTRSAVERGAGLIGTLSGTTVVLVLLLFAVQIALALYATSAVTAVAYDAARVVAGADDGADRRSSARLAEVTARRTLGRTGARTRFTWRVDDDWVELRVESATPSMLPPAWRRPLGIDTVDRTVRVRTERLR